MNVPIGLHLTSFAFSGVASEDRLDRALAIAQAAEAAGFDSLWVNDHLLDGPAPDGPRRPEAYLFLCAAATATRHIRLGALASSVYFRNPMLLARMAVTLDQVSKGRTVLGIGAGHPRTEGEHAAFGFDFPPLRQRMDHLEAVLPEIRREVGRIPILVAGSGEHRLLRIAARYADYCNLSMPAGDTLELVRHRLGVLATHCRAVGRDYTSITKTYKAMLRLGGTSVDAATGQLTGDADSIRRGAQAFVDAGVDEIIVQVEGVEELDRVAEAAAALRGVMRPVEAVR
jgi:alkanesulfonate monooxygenase SsuD/methylene tetrahydromethanopterin reductase-like flavin-dependent oxidoreductase (luciferase family)